MDAVGLRFKLPYSQLIEFLDPLPVIHPQKENLKRTKDDARELL